MIEVFIPDYFIQISSSQHGWISIVIINNQCYDWGFQNRFSATAIIFINGNDLFYNGGNSPESLQAYDPALGGYIIQVEITTNMQVPCHCQHAPWHLGANAKSFFCSTYWRPDSSHSKWADPWGLLIAPVKNSRYTSINPLYWTVHYSVTKLLTLWTWVQAPWWRLHHMMLLSMNYLQSPCSLLHNDPALGGYTGWSFMSIRQLQVPGCCKHDNPTLGGYIIWSVQFLFVTGMNNRDFFIRGNIHIEASLKLLLRSLLKTWGLQVICI